MEKGIKREIVKALFKYYLENVMISVITKERLTNNTVKSFLRKLEIDSLRYIAPDMFSSIESIYDINDSSVILGMYPEYVEAETKRLHGENKQMDYMYSKALKNYGEFLSAFSSELDAAGVTEHKVNNIRITQNLNYTEPSSFVKKAKMLLDNSGQIVLQGAPGCGKTYVTSELAVYLCEGAVPDNRADLKKRYAELESEGRIAFTTFHQSLDYEEFVEGLKPEISASADENMNFVVKPGIFKRICTAAAERSNTNFDDVYKKFCEDIEESEDKKTLQTQSGKTFAVSVNSNGNLTLYTGPELKGNGVLTKENLKLSFEGTYYEAWQPYFKSVVRHLVNTYGLVQSHDSTIKNYVLIIDEVNRANVSKVFGELITLLEKSKRLGNEDEVVATLPYSGEKFGVPDNLYIVATMNTADRSLGYIDYAIRRRFSFLTLQSSLDAIIAYYGDSNAELLDKARTVFEKVHDLIVNNISDDFDADDIMVGHSYFMAKTEADLSLNVEYKIMPLLNEYLRDGILLASDGIKEQINSLLCKEEKSEDDVPTDNASDVPEDDEDTTAEDTTI